MKIVYAKRAVAQIDWQFAHGIETFGAAVATRTMTWLRRFIETALACYPRTGTWDASWQAFEAWCPQTPFVVVYRIDQGETTLIVLAVFHHAQDRESFSGDAP